MLPAFVPFLAGKDACAPTSYGTFICKRDADVFFCLAQFIHR